MRFSALSRATWCLATAMSAASCAPAARNADTLAAVDTLKPAVASLPDSGAVAAPRQDTATRPATTAKASSTTKTQPAASKQTGTVVARDTAHLGRDSVIRINPNDPRRQLPTIPPKKPL